MNCSPCSEADVPPDTPRQPWCDRRHSAGFTLIELLVTLAVATLLLGVGLPNFRNLRDAYRLSSQTNLLVSALHLARSEAIKLGDPVILCKGRNTLCNPGAGWSDEWLLFHDRNGDKHFSPSNDTLIRHYAASPSLTISTASNYTCWMGFGANGYPIGGGADCLGKGLGNDTFRLCPGASEGIRTGRRVVINATGRIRTEDTPC